MIPEILELTQTESEVYLDTVWHSHPAAQLGYVLSEHEVIHVSGQTHRIPEGGLYLLARGHLHRIESAPGNAKFRGFVNLTASPDSFSESAASMVDFGWLDGRTLIAAHSPDAGGWMREITSFWAAGTPESRLVAQCLLLRLFVSLEELKPLLIERDSSVEHHMVFEQAVRLVEASFKQADLRVDDLARACCVSRSFLDKLFYRRLGYGPKQFIQRYRVDRALELIRLGSASISQVAEATGFNDIFAFSRVFKRLTGRPPAAFRSPRG